MVKSTPTLKLICGLEIHAELKTASKMFCGCKNDPFNAPHPNMYTCPVCLGMPGGLPVPNRKAVEWVIQLGLALNCQINLFSKFDRKHYFYPDLAKGYQISQYDIPFCHSGLIETSEGPIRIRRIHLEEDTGKLLHTTLNNEKVSLVDFNRSGVPLVEIVTEPDIRTASQAAEFGRIIRHLIRFLDIGDARMQEGGMRLEANVSLSKDGELPNYKVEVKNINSFKFLEQAITYEVGRQSEIIAHGDVPPQETRGWNIDQNQTFSQRTKESAEDYRYFPDPDIPPIQMTKAQLKRIADQLGELPSAIVSRWAADHQVEERFGQMLVTDRSTVALLDEVFHLATNQQFAANTIAKDIVNKNLILADHQTAQSIVESCMSLHTTDSIDETELSTAIRSILEKNPDAVTKYRSGKTQVIGFILGQIAQALPKKLNMKLIRQKLLSELEA